MNRRKIMMICERLLNIIDNHFTLPDGSLYENKLSKNVIIKLQWGANEFGSHGCNDLPKNFWNGLTISERQEFVKKFHEWNGDPEEYDPNFLHLPDFAVMRFVSEYLKGNVKFLNEERKEKLIKLGNN